MHDTLANKAIILAAGRGSRLAGLTADRPKCLVELDGSPLLAWQMASLGSGGLADIVVVTGYRHELLKPHAPRTLHAPHWAETNMVQTLLCAAGEITAPTVISYSDIVFSPVCVGDLAAAQGDICITYDPNWLALWSKRFADPLSDAETFRIKEGLIVEIGSKTDDIELIEGQYMGLLKLTPTGLAWIRSFLDANPGIAATIDMTALLSGLLAAGHPIHGVPIADPWCEIDTPSDLAIAQAMVAKGELRFQGRAD